MMESLTLRAALRECAVFFGRTVSAVRAAADESAITIHCATANDGILLDMSAGRPGVCRVDAPDGPLPPAGRAGAEGGRMTALAALAEERLRGARAVSFDQAGLDRVAVLRFARRDRLGDPVPLTVIVELFGAWGNIILLDGPPETGKILDRLRLDNRKDAPRALGRGRNWEPLPRERVDITTDGDEELLRRLSADPPADARDWAARLCRDAEGMSPFTAREVVRRAGDPPTAETLTLAWRTFVDEAGAGGPAWTWRTPTGAARVLTWEPRAHAENAKPGAPPTVERFPGVAAACAALRTAPAAAPAGDPKMDLDAHLRKKRDDAQRLLGRLHGERERRSDGTEYRRRAEALLAHAGEVPRGASSVTLPDPRGGDDVTIALDPARTVMENADRCFKEARKADQAELRLPKKIAAAEEGLRKIEALLEKLAALDPLDERALRRMEDDVYGRSGGPANRGGPPAGGGGKPKAPDIPAAMRPRRYEMPGGWVILVGRSNTGNDYLTHKLAAPRDLWFHAHGAAGSHVVLKAPNSKIEPDRAIITAAAALAALNSKARHASRVPVIYTEKRYVRKPRGGKPGLASVTREKSVMVKPAAPQVESEE